MDKSNKIDRIIETFLNLCNVKPFNEISMREVARNACVSHTLVFKYFPTKGELISASYYSIIAKDITLYQAADSLGELVCALIETFEDYENIAALFTEAFSCSADRSVIYSITRDMLFKEVLRLCNGNKSTAEASYVCLIALSFYPDTMRARGETSIKGSYKDVVRNLILSG